MRQDYRIISEWLADRIVAYYDNLLIYIGACTSAGGVREGYFQLPKKPLIRTKRPFPTAVNPNPCVFGMQYRCLEHFSHASVKALPSI